MSEHVQSKLYNLHIKLEQFSEKTKKFKKLHLVGIELSINDNTKSPQKWILPQFLNMSKTCAIYKPYNLQIYRPQDLEAMEFTDSYDSMNIKNDWKSSKHLKSTYLYIPYS